MAPKYREWLDLNAKKIQVEDTFRSNVNVSIYVHGGKGWRMNRDLDNIFKGVLDLMVKSNALKDDCTKIVKEVRAAYCPPSNKTDDAYLIVKMEGYTSEAED